MSQPVDLIPRGERSYFDVAAGSLYHLAVAPATRRQALMDAAECGDIIRPIFLLLVFRNPPPVAFEMLAPLFDDKTWTRLPRLAEETFSLLTGSRAPAGRVPSWPFDGPTPEEVARELPRHFQEEPRWAETVMNLLAEPARLESWSLRQILPHAVLASPDDIVKRVFTSFFAPRSRAWTKLRDGTPAKVLLGAIGSVGTALLKPAERHRLVEKLYTAGILPLLADLQLKPETHDHAALLAMKAATRIPAADASGAYDAMSPFFTPEQCRKNANTALTLLRELRPLRSNRLYSIEPRWKSLFDTLGKTSLQHEVRNIDGRQSGAAGAKDAKKAPRAAKKKAGGRGKPGPSRPSPS